MKKTICLLLAMYLLQQVFPPFSVSVLAYDRDFVDILDYGAVGDGKTMNTKAIQTAIDNLTEQGGGILYFPSGIYLTGSIKLHSNITIQLVAGAVIKASPDMKDYTPIEYSSESRNTSLMYAVSAENIAIMGRGEIDGSGDEFMDLDKIYPGCCYDPRFTRQGLDYHNDFPDGPVAPKLNEDGTQARPGTLVTFIQCNNVMIRDITVTGAPNWCIHLACCNHVDIIGVDIHNSLLIPNADGIDLSKSRNINISDCDIIAGDDGIAIGTCADGYCRGVAENINVNNCIITSRSAAIRLGWSTDDIRNCTFTNLVLHSNRGIGIFVRHDEVIENITFFNIIIKTRLHTGWWGNGEPVHISEIPLGELHGLSSEGKKNGEVRNIRFSDMFIKGESGIVLYGHHENSLSDIKFDNIKFTLKNSELNEDYGGNFDLRPAYSEEYALFKHDIPALYARFIKVLEIKNFDLVWDDDIPEFYTDGIYCENFESIVIDGFTGKQAGSADRHSAIQLENGDGAWIRNCEALPGTGTFLFYDHMADFIIFSNNQLKYAQESVNQKDNRLYMEGNIK